MACTCPLDAYPASPDAPNRRIVFNSKASYAGATSFKVPCGQCLGCRLDKARDWAVRCTHEAQMHEANCFITPTFSDEFLPSDLSVSVVTHQLFMKRLRDAFGALRFFGCGEYGEDDLRPHYHYLIFGQDFTHDRYIWKRSRGGYLYRSPSLEKCWPFGHILIGDVTFQSAGYVARYNMKKLGGDMADAAYRRFNPDTGEVWQVKPPFLLMSRRPGIGVPWFNKFADDAFPSDFVTVEGRKLPVPRLYKDFLDEREALRIAARRKAQAREHVDNNTDARLMVRDEVLQRRVAHFERTPSSSGDL